jgi:hypothetical protein
VDVSFFDNLIHAVPLQGWRLAGAPILRWPTLLRDVAAALRISDGLLRRGASIELAPAVADTA